MSEKVSKWLDMGYKFAVLLGSVALVWAHATFASKQDIGRVSDAIHQIELQLVKMEAQLLAQTTERGHLSEEVRVIRETQKEMELRLRTLERK
jgi:septal ring factor EnvC (AmiA/AmiB activator)